MIRVEVIENGNGKIVRLGGQLTIEEALELKTILSDALDGAESLKAEIGGVEGCDLTCLQVFCSCHRTAVSLNKVFTIAGDYPKHFMNLIADSGYLRHRGCTDDPSITCLWKEEAHG